MKNFLHDQIDALDAQINKIAIERAKLSDDTDREAIQQWAEIESVLVRANIDLTLQIVRLLQRGGE